MSLQTCMTYFLLQYKSFKKSVVRTALLHTIKVDGDRRFKKATKHYKSSLYDSYATLVMWRKVPNLSCNSFKISENPLQIPSSELRPDHWITELNLRFKTVQLMNESFKLDSMERRNSKEWTHSQKNDSFKHLYSCKCA